MFILDLDISEAFKHQLKYMQELYIVFSAVVIYGYLGNFTPDLDIN